MRFERIAKVDLDVYEVGLRGFVGLGLVNWARLVAFIVATGKRNIIGWITHDVGGTKRPGSRLGRQPQLFCPCFVSDTRSVIRRGAGHERDDVSLMDLLRLVAFMVVTGKRNIIGHITYDVGGTKRPGSRLGRQPQLFCSFCPCFVLDTRSVIRRGAGHAPNGLMVDFNVGSK
ncbi:hypothetical protein Tco_1515102 [Tanacetum coccineum]